MTDKGERALWFIALALCLMVLALGVTSGGESQSDSYAVNAESGTSVFYNVTRFVDDEAGVACWVRAGGGISCLPLRDTLLGTGR